MSISSCYKSTKILKFIAQLIIEYDYDDYDDLSESDKAALTSLLCEASGRSDEYSCIVESAFADQTINAFRKALSGTQADNEAFLEIIKENAINYFDYTMRALFNYVYTDYLHNFEDWMENIGSYGNPDALRDGL